MSEAPALVGKALVAMMIKNQPVVVEINGIDAPKTAGNFVDLVERGVYDGIAFHRIVREPGLAIVQGGDPQGRDPNIPVSQLGTGGFVDPQTQQRRSIPLEIKAQGATEPTYSQTINPPVQLPHQQGVIAMARSNAPDTASSQFYFTLADISSTLDGRYSVFGTLAQGFDIIDQVQIGDRVSTAKVIAGIVPSRVSTMLTDATQLNTFINRVNVGNLPLRVIRLTEEADVKQLTETESQQNTGGVLGLGGNDVITGSTTIDFIQGNAGNDTLRGGGGDDYIRGGKGNDLLDGGEGNDILSGGINDDTLEGGLGNDFLRGGKGNDVLIGGEGNDVLIGDKGVNSLTGGNGADHFILNSMGNTQGDTILDFNATQGDKIGITTDVSMVQLTTSGSDILIQVSGATIGTVKNAALDSVKASLFTVAAPTGGVQDALPPGDAAFRIG